MRLLKAAFACATLTTSLLLVGCGGAPATEPDPAPEEPPAETVVEDEDAQPDGEAIVEEILSRNDDEPKDVEPDEDVMASMTCVPLTPEQLESLTLRFGIFDRGVSVDVTEKDGVTWKVVALQQTAADGTPTRLAYLTDAVDLSWGEGETWIELESGDPWRNVDWDDELLVRGQSALTLAQEWLSEGIGTSRASRDPIRRTADDCR